MNMEDGKASRQVGSLAALPREIAPARDLWPGVVARIETGAEQQRAPRWALALAAGIVALAIGVLLGRWTLGIDGAAAPAGALPSNGFLEAAYVAERTRLRGDVLRQIENLPSQDREQVLVSVRALQRAIDDIQLALGRDPGNALLQELLVNACQDEMTSLNDIYLAAGGGSADRTVEHKL